MPERIKLIVEYDGTNYSGWQRQINAMSVQQRLEEGLKKLTGESITVTGSSRTDFLVNADEGGLLKPAIRQMREHVFRTATGVRLLDSIYSLDKE